MGIDIYNLEASVWRPHRASRGNAIPAIQPSFTQSSTRSTCAFNPKKDGRISMVIEAGRRLKSALPQADVRIPVAGPFSIGVNLRGITGLCEK